MSGSTGTMVECPVCGEEFDPAAAGGWCTNPECGEWQHEAASSEPDTGESSPDVGELFDSGEGSAETEESGDDETAEPTAGAETGEPDPDPEAEPGHSETGGPDSPTEESTGSRERSEAADSEGGNLSAGEIAADVDGSEGDESDAGEDEEPDGADTATESPEGDESVRSDESTPRTESADEPETIECPGCGDELGADANFCASCGEDVSAIEPGDGEVTDCPSCGTEVDPGDNFCASCGEDLSEVGAAVTLSECPECGEDVDDEDMFCAACGADLAAHRSGDGSADGESASSAGETTESPESLVLATRGEELSVSDGDTVGRELRRIITETGGDDDDAVRVHREHVRFVRENGRFHLVDLGTNPTRLNGDQLEKGDREPLEPGDVIELSGVIGLAVEAP